MFDGLTYPLPASETRILVCTSCDGKNRLPLHRALEQPDKARCGRCGKPLLIAKESPLRVTGTTIRHPLDQKASEALEAVPGVSTLLRKLVEVTSERYDRLFNQSSYVRVTLRQFPHVLRQFEKVAARLSLKDVPDLYVYGSGEVNAYTSGVEKHYVALSSSLCDSLSADELAAVMAHELTHILADHVLYKTAARLFTFAAGELAKATLGVGQLLLIPLQLALLKWDRCSELTADRGMLLATSDPMLSLKVLAKLACGSRRLSEQLSLEDFMQQALAARQAPEENVLDKIYSLMQTAARTHPFPLWRAAELWQWSCRGEYLSLLRAIPDLASAQAANDSASAENEIQDAEIVPPSGS
ncbi:MAG TPA: M48 family metalloprotease [Pseudomonadota bacterium]|jgi:Zn-dependent protease with chaperone function|nr:M48 family metalloprotease [Pseudomonadota bacterium]